MFLPRGPWPLSACACSFTVLFITTLFTKIVPDVSKVTSRLYGCREEATFDFAVLTLAFGIGNFHWIGFNVEFETFLSQSDT